jgi:hypothetical protein
MEEYEINYRVFCHVYGMGLVKDIVGNISKRSDMHFYVKFDNGKAGFYSISGRLSGTGGTPLFSLEIKPTKQ